MGSGGCGVLKPTVPKATANGYTFVFVANQTQQLFVYYDNLQLAHLHSPVLSETSYYPGGLPMTGISTKDAGKQGNSYKFNGKELQSEEFSDGNGLEVYDYGARMQDPQLMVWHNIDPHADNSSSWSPYVYVNDNPIRYFDPNGMDGEETDKVRYEMNPDGTIQQVYVSEKEYQQNTNGGTTNMVTGDPSTGDLQYNYKSADGSTAFSTPNFHGSSYYDGAPETGTGKQVELNGGSFAASSKEEGSEKSEAYENFSKFSDATALGADSHAVAITTAAAISKDAGEALRGLSRTGTVIGAIAAGVPAAINLADSWGKGNIGSLKDWIGLGEAGLGLLAEFSGLGEAYDGTVGVVIAVGMTAYDIYSATKE